MKCIVPLAGPDLVHPQHHFRPWVPVDGQPLLRRAIDGRAWRSEFSPSDYVFVVRQVAEVHRLTDWLETQWPGCRIVMLSDLTGGAMMSVLAGLSLTDPGEPVVVDLADILFSAGPGALKPLFSPPNVGMVVPCFPSRDPNYSYLRQSDGKVVEAAEKRVISDRASAGVYIFRDPQVFLSAAAHALDHRDSQAYHGVLFVCPMANGVIAAGLDVLIPDVSPVVPLSKMFHGL